MVLDLEIISRGGSSFLTDSAPAGGATAFVHRPFTESPDQVKNTEDTKFKVNPVSGCRMCGILLLLNLVSISTHGHHQITAHIMDNVTLLFQSSGVPVYGVFLKILGHDKYIYSCRDGRHVDANQQEPRPGGWVVQEEKYICGNRSIEEVSVGLPNVTIYDTNTYEWWVQEGKEEAFKKFFTVSMIVKSRDVTTIHPRAGLSTAERTTAEETTAENATTGYATAENVTAGNATNVVLIMLAVVVVVVVVLLKLCGKFNPKSDLSVTYTECVQEQI